MRLTEKDWKDKRAGYPWTVHPVELLEMYTRDECAYDFELILSALGISSNILDQFQP